MFLSPHSYLPAVWKFCSSFCCYIRRDYGLGYGTNASSQSSVAVVFLIEVLKLCTVDLHCFALCTVVENECVDCNALSHSKVRLRHAISLCANSPFALLAVSELCVRHLFYWVHVGLSIACSCLLLEEYWLQASLLMLWIAFGLVGKSKTIELLSCRWLNFPEAQQAQNCRRHWTNTWTFLDCRKQINSTLSFAPFLRWSR